MAFADGMKNDEQVGNAEMKSILDIIMLLIYKSSETDYNVIPHKIFTL